MTGLLAFVALALGATAWLVLPLLPALRELLRPTDADPLTMVGQDAGELTVFADGFRAYLARQLDASPEAVAHPGAPLPRTVGTFADGTRFVRLDGRPELLDTIAGPDRTIEHLVLVSAPARLPGGETFVHELHARAPFVGGPGAAYRAILADDDLALGERSTVLRWVHGERDIVVGDRSTLPGRASARGTLRLGADVAFARVRAERIVVGEGRPEEADADALRGTVAGAPWRAPADALAMPGHVRVQGDVSVPAGAVVEGSLVVTGDLRVGAGARIRGSLKAHGSIVLGDRVVVEGSVVSRESLRAAPWCRIGGPAIAERRASLGAGTVVGAPGHPSTVAAPVIELEDGCEIHGALAARDRGVTVVGSRRAAAPAVVAPPAAGVLVGAGRSPALRG